MRLLEGQTGSIGEILRGFPVWGETMWSWFVTADTTIRSLLGPHCS